MSLTLRIQRLPHSEGLELPSYESAGAAGMDLRAAISETIVMAPNQRVLVPTGLCIELPADHEAQVRPRSGLSIKHGITVINAPGTIDEDYRGEVQVPLVNLSNEPFEVTRGMRIAQMVIASVTRLATEEVGELSGSLRGKGGFGSTGL